MKLLVNVLPFLAPTKDVSLVFSREKVQDSDVAILKKEFPQGFVHKNYAELKGVEKLYCDFENQDDGDFRADVNMNEATQFALHYFRFLIREYFEEQRDIIVSCNKIKDIEVAIPAKVQPSDQYTEYYCFTIKVQCRHVSEYFEMVISYDGMTRKLNKTMPQLNEAEQELVRNVVIGNTVYHKDMDADIVNYGFEDAYPILSNPLRRYLNLEVDNHKSENRYLNALTYINGFCVKYLYCKAFEKVLKLVKKELLILSEDIINTLPESAKMLQFRDYRREIVEDTNVLQFKNIGPYQISQPSEYQLKVVFIYQQDTGKTARDFVYNAFMKGALDAVSSKGFTYQRIKPMYKAIRKDFHTEQDIVFSNMDNAVKEIADALKVRNIDQNAKYLAIYISPISQNSREDKHYQTVYAQIKEVLISNNITSQGFYEENLRRQDELQYYFTNMYAAILGKINGIPWQLKSSNPDNLIIGVGAFYSKKKNKRYIGSAFCFDGNGVFSEFACSHENSRDVLIANLHKAIENYLENNKGKHPSRIVIHFYKELSNNDWKPLLKMLNDISWDIPIIVATINKTETKDIVAFDNDCEDKMPMSGTYINVDKQTYLMYNNTKYDQKTFNTQKRKTFHFPIKVRLDSHNSQVLEDETVVKEVLEQIYQLSRMYWKSVDQQSVPITVKYPELIARIVPYFKNDIIPNPDFGCHNPWFL